MKKRKKKLLSFCSMICIAIIGVTACSTSGPKETTPPAQSGPEAATQTEAPSPNNNDASDSVEITAIDVHAKMTSFGKLAESIEISVNDVTTLMNLSPEDFMLSNCLMEAASNTLGSFPAKSLSFTSNSIIIEVEPFLIERSNGDFGEPFTLNCTNSALSFTYKDITAVKCPEHDAFTDETSTAGATTVQYKLYSPDNADGELLPVVIYNHGGGNTGYDGVLTDDSYACSWAVDSSQAKMPCFVIAPYRASVADRAVNADEEREAIKAAVDQLIESGKADPERIYMTGESMGSLYTITFANKYPGYLAAIAIMDGGPMDVPDEGTPEENAQLQLESPWSDEELQTLADSGTSVMFIQGIGDPLSYPMKYATVYTKLKNMGMIPGSNLMWESYTAAQFNALINDNTILPSTDASEVAIDPITGNETYTNGNFHNSSRVAGWDTYVKNWLMLQTLSEEPTFTPAAVSTDIPENFTKVQTILYAHATGNELEITCAMNEDETEFYLSYMFFGDQQIAQGNIDGDTVEVTYDRTGFAAGDAADILKNINKDNWEPVN